jgi:hypothetical protein
VYPNQLGSLSWASRSIPPLRTGRGRVLVADVQHPLSDCFCTPQVLLVAAKRTASAGVMTRGMNGAVRRRNTKAMLMPEAICRTWCP